MRSTRLALMRASTLKTVSDFVATRSPLINTLALAWPNPRPWSSLTILNPGTWLSMSSALRGAKRAKSAGV